MVKTKSKRGRKAVTKIKAISGRPLNDKEIQQFVAFYNERGYIPGHKIACNVTGKLSVCTGPWMKKKIKEFGSVEALLRGYKCRAALKKTKVKPIGKGKGKKGRPAKGKPGRPKKDKVAIEIPKMPTGTQRPETAAEFKEASHIACARPDIYLDNGRNCEGCPHYAICECDIKKLPKGVAFRGGKFVAK